MLEKIDPKYRNITGYNILDFLIWRNVYKDYRWWGEAKFLPVETAPAIFLGLLKGGYFRRWDVDYVLRYDDHFFQDEKSFAEFQPYRSAVEKWTNTHLNLQTPPRKRGFPPPR